MQKSLFPFALAGVLLAASSVFADESSKTDKPDPRIGEEVNQICFARTINGWKPIKGVDNVVLLQKGVHDWHYVELTGYCPSHIFRSAESIGIESHPSGGCLTRGDVIVVRDFGHFTSRCFISKISKWDDKAKAPKEDEESPQEENSQPDQED